MQGDVKISLTANPPSAGLRGRAALAAARCSLAVRRDCTSLTFRIVALGGPSTLRMVSEQRRAGSPARRRRPGRQPRIAVRQIFTHPLHNPNRIRFPQTLNPPSSSSGLNPEDPHRDLVSNRLFNLWHLIGMDPRVKPEDDGGEGTLLRSLGPSIQRHIKEHANYAGPSIKDLHNLFLWPSIEGPAQGRYLGFFSKVSKVG